MATGININGDKRLCKKCNAKADIVERGVDLCADCYSKQVWGMPISEVHKNIQAKELEKERI